MKIPMQTALITGASSGIGVDLAFEFAKRGHHLVLLARREDRLLQVKSDILSQYPALQVHILVEDLIQDDALKQIQEFLTANNISIDYLVNNAGFGLRGQFHELDQQRQLDMITLNVTRLTELCRHFLPSMLAKNSGGILNVASVAGFQPGPKMSVYFASKAFVLFLSEGIYEEIKPSHVLISTLCPGPTASEFGKVSDMENTRLFDHGVMASAEVARIGVDGFFVIKPS
ncbi:MAG: SDR family oxidoreductase [Bdellovibrionota bacterium]